MLLKEKEEILLEWFKNHEEEGLADGYEFALLYKFLFGGFPYWYTWRSFYRDHGFIGVR